MSVSAVNAASRDQWWQSHADRQTDITCEVSLYLLISDWTRQRDVTQQWRGTQTQTDIQVNRQLKTESFVSCCQPTSTCLGSCVCIAVCLCPYVCVRSTAQPCYLLLSSLRYKVFVICRLYATVSNIVPARHRQSLLVSLLAMSALGWT